MPAEGVHRSCPRGRSRHRARVPGPTAVHIDIVEDQAPAGPLIPSGVKGRALFVGAHERVVHQILGINVVTCERLSIATQSRKPAEDVEASLSTYQ